MRQAVLAAMRILGRQFVMGRTIEEALDRARAPRSATATGIPTTCSARRRARRADAARYHAAYRHAIGRDRRDRRRAVRPSKRRASR